MQPLVDRLVDWFARLMTFVLHLPERFGAWWKGNYYGIQDGIKLLASDTVDSSKKYDFVIMFKGKYADSKRAEFRQYIAKLLTDCGFLLTQKQPEYGSKARVYFLLKAPLEFLVRYAADADVHQLSKTGDYVLVTPDSLSQLKSAELLFDSIEKQRIIVNALMQHCRMKETDKISPAWVGRWRARSFRPGVAVIAKAAAHRLLHLWPTHETQTRESLSQIWFKNSAEVLRQPLAEIRKYFGDIIAFYFAWLAYYTRLLVVVAVGGVAVELLRALDVSSKPAEFFGLFALSWGYYFCDSWNRERDSLVKRWQCHPPPKRYRPEWTGETREDPTTGSVHHSEWKWRRLARYLISVPVSLALVVVVFFFLFEYVELKVALKAKYGKLAALCIVIPYSLLSIALSKIYRMIAIKLNRLENYAMEETYERVLVWRVFAFEVLNSYLSIYWLLFGRGTLKIDSLRESLLLYVLIKQLGKNFVETVVMYYFEKFKQYRLHRRLMETIGQNDQGQDPLTPSSPSSSSLSSSSPSSSSSSLSSSDPPRHQIESYELEAKQEVYPGTIYDGIEKVIQFGFVCIFACVFPIVGLLAFLKNLVELRADAFRFCHIYRRPIAHSATDVGEFPRLCKLILVLAVITNIALYKYTPAWTL